MALAGLYALVYFPEFNRAFMKQFITKKDAHIAQDLLYNPILKIFPGGNNHGLIDNSHFTHLPQRIRKDDIFQKRDFREAFLTIEGHFDCVDIFNYIRKQELTEQIPIDNIADALERFREKGELKLVKETPPKKYRRIITPT